MVYMTVLWYYNDVGREDLTRQCQLDRDASNVTVHQPIVITAEKNAADMKSTQKADSDGMSYLDHEVSIGFDCEWSCCYDGALTLLVGHRGEHVPHLSTSEVMIHEELVYLYLLPLWRQPACRTSNSNHQRSPRKACADAA